MEENSYEYVDAEVVEKSSDEIREAFLNAAKTAQLDNVQSIFIQLYKETVAELAEANRALLEENDFYEDFSNLLYVVKSSTDSISSGYKVVSKDPSTGELSSKVIEADNALYDVVEQYYKVADKSLIVGMRNKIKELFDSQEMKDEITELHQLYNGILKTLHLSDEQEYQAQEFFTQIPATRFTEKTEENAFCFDALEAAQSMYDSHPKLGLSFMKLPDVVQKDPKDLTQELTDEKINSNGVKKIKSSVGHVKDMQPKKVVKKSDAEKLEKKSMYENLIKQGTVLPLEELREYTNGMTEAEKEKFINQVTATPKINAKYDISKIFENAIDKPEYKDYKWHYIKRIKAYYHFRRFHAKLRKAERKAKLQKWAYGDKPVTISQLFDTEKENSQEVPINMLIKASYDAKQIKLTKDAAEKLKETNPEDVKTEEAEIVPVNDTIQEIINRVGQNPKTSDSEAEIKENPEQISDDIAPEISIIKDKSSDLEDNNLEKTNDNLKDMTKEELIEMIQNGTILSTIPLEKIEEEAQNRRAEEEKQTYLQRQQEGMERYKRTYIIRNAQSNPEYVNNPEKQQEYLAENNISDLEWQMGKGLSDEEYEKIAAEQNEYNQKRQDLIEYAATYSGIDRYALLKGIPGSEANEYGVTNADVENYIQATEEIKKVENGKSK